MIILPESNAHWYDPKTGGPRHDATLREARKEGLYGSVTSIIKVAAKPQLQAWLQSQAVLSSLTLPRIEGETDDAFAKRVIVDMNAQSSKAAEFGTQIHKEIERINIGSGFATNIKYVNYLIGYYDWFNGNITEVIHAEKVLVNNKVGYAGTVDLVARHKEWGLIVLDVKTQGVKDKPVFYEDWAWQLCAYGQCIESPIRHKLVSCIINSKEPSEPAFKVWENEGDAWEAFLACHKLWTITKQYFPQTS